MINFEKRQQYSKKDTASVFMLALIVPSLLIAILGIVLKAIFPSMSTTTYYYILLGLNQLLFLLIFYVYNKVAKIDVKSANNINFHLNFSQIVIIILIGMVAMYGFASLVNYLEWVISKLGYTSSSFSYLVTDNFGMLVVNLLVVALLPAICEELIFRGVILNGLNKYKPVTMIVLSGLMFSLFHLSIEQSIYQFVLGMALSSIVMITGTIFSSMILHFFNNALILIISFISSSQTSSEIIAPTSVLDHILPFVLALVSFALIYLLLCLLKRVTKNPKYQIFNFKKQSKVEQQANIDILSQPSQTILEQAQNEQQTQLDEQNNQSNGKTKAKNLFFNDFGNVLIVLSIVLGVAMWLISVVPNFIVK